MHNIVLVVCDLILLLIVCEKNCIVSKIDRHCIFLHLQCQIDLHLILFVHTCRYKLIMTPCWNLLPEKRMTFKQLVQLLQEYWEVEHAYVVEDTTH